MRKLSITKRGPLPDSKEFKEYERALPGAGDRILKWLRKNKRIALQLLK